MADPTSPPIVLNLDTQTVRPCVAIDGTRYDLLSVDDLSIVESHQHIRDSARLSALVGQLQGEALSDEEGIELARLLDTSCRRLLPAPDAVHAQLRDGQRMAILHTFLELPTPTTIRRPAGAKTMTPEVLAAGPISSPGSSASTEATP